MKNKRRIIGIVAATVLALVGTFALVSYVRSATDDAVADEALVDVYVVDEFVPKGAEPGTIMSAVSVEQVPARLIQDGALTDYVVTVSAANSRELHDPHRQRKRLLVNRSLLHLSPLSTFNSPLTSSSR